LKLISVYEERNANNVKAAVSYWNNVRFSATLSNISFEDGRTSDRYIDPAPHTASIFTPTFEDLEFQNFVACTAALSVDNVVTFKVTLACVPTFTLKAVVAGERVFVSGRNAMVVGVLRGPLCAS